CDRCYGLMWLPAVRTGFPYATLFRSEDEQDSHWGLAKGDWGQWPAGSLPSPAASAALELRLAAVEEGADALGEVLGGAALPEESGLLAEPLREREVGRAQGLERERHGHRRLPRDGDDELLRHAEERLRRGDAVDEADLVGPLRRDPLARQQQLRRDPAPDEAGQPLRAAVAGDEAEVHLGLP